MLLFFINLIRLKASEIEIFISFMDIQTNVCYYFQTILFQFPDHSNRRTEGGDLDHLADRQRPELRLGDRRPLLHRRNAAGAQKKSESSRKIKSDIPKGSSFALY